MTMIIKTNIFMYRNLTLCAKSQYHRHQIIIYYTVPCFKHCAVKTTLIINTSSFKSKLYCFSYNFNKKLNRFLFCRMSKSEDK